MKLSTTTFLSFAAALLLPACGMQEKNTPAERMTGSLDSLFSCYFQSDGPGAVVLVKKGDSVIYDHSFGLADLATKAPMTDSTMLNICSVSKQFGAVALLKLAEEGRISLDDPVSKYFPQFKALFFARISLANLLSHTSGLPDARPRTEEQWRRYRSIHDSRFATVDDFALFCEEDESLRFMESLDSLAFEPGTAYEYQNPTFQLILPIVEKVTGEDFDTWMRRNIFDSAGMPETVYFEPDRRIPRMAHGYDLDSLGQWRECDYGEARFFGTKADGGLYTSAREFLNWDAALYGDKVISASSREKAHSVYTDTDIPDTGYGYGFFIELRHDRPEKIYHTGDNGGFYIFEGRFPSRDVFYLIFATHPQWPREAVVESVDSILVANKII